MDSLRCRYLQFAILAAFVIHQTTSQKPQRRCLDGSVHLKEPANIPLEGVCADWSGDTCCSNATSVSIGTNDTWHNFNWDHCGDRKLSTKCREHFIRDLCFYECDPNVWPWLVEDRRKIRNETFVGVPLCQRDCDAWYEDCKDDLTCTENWNADFKWINGANTCPTGKSCKTFSEIYGNAKGMCEKIFGNSFLYAFDAQPCFLLNFNGTQGNPNKRIAEWKASTGTNSGAYSDYSLVSRKYVAGVILLSVAWQSLL